MAKDTTLAMQLCNDEENDYQLELPHATGLFEQLKRRMRAENMETGEEDERPTRGDHITKITLTDKNKKRLNEFRHKCICESPY